MHRSVALVVDEFGDVEGLVSPDAARHSIVRTRMTKIIGWLERPARFIDRFLRPRLSTLVEGFAVRVIATVSLLISLAMRGRDPDDDPAPSIERRLCL